MKRAAPALAVILSVLCLPGCFLSHDRETDADLRDPVGNGEGSAGAPDDDTQIDQPGADDAIGEASGERNHDGPSVDTPDVMVSTGGAADPAADAWSVLNDPRQVWLGETRGRLKTCTDEHEASLTAPHRERILLVLELDEGGAPRAASVTLGGHPPPPPAQDPDALYPAGTDYQRSCALHEPTSGFEYPAHGIRRSSGRLELTIYASDIFSSWCALQESYPASETARSYFGADYLCRPSDDVQSLDDVNALHARQREVVGMCLGDFSRVCDCDADGCWPRRMTPITLDLVVDGDTLQGRVIDHVVGVTEVKLERVQ